MSLQRSPCSSCGSTTYEEENGIFICTSCGRQAESLGIFTVDDDADFGTQGKITRRKVEKIKVKISKVLTGPAAYKLYLIGWQHILWKQAHVLINGVETGTIKVKTPPELWTVAKDLWTLRLTKLVRRLDSSNDGGSKSSSNKDDTSTESDMEPTSDAPQRAATIQPKLYDTIATIYLASLLLRLPISLHSIYTVILTETIPFIRAVRHLPHEISSKLPPEYQLALDTTTVPTKRQLSQAIYSSTKFYTDDAGISLPSLNWRILLFNWIQELGLPIELYPYIDKLAKLVGYEFTYRMRSSQKMSEKRKRRTPVSMPEVQLISLVVISTKLLFPFNANPRPTKSDEKSYYPMNLIRLDWLAWHQIHKDRMKTSKTTSEMRADEAIATHDGDIPDLTLEQMDNYMDWYQRTFTMPNAVLRAKKTDLEMSIMDMFPVLEGAGVDQSMAFSDMQERTVRTESFVAATQRESIYPAQSNQVRDRDPSASDLEERQLGPAGSRYQIFPVPSSLKTTTLQPIDNHGNTSKDSLPYHSSEEESPALYFHRIAAEMACIDLNGLLRAVRHTERKLEQWVREKRTLEALVSPNEIDEVLESGDVYT